VSSLVDSLHQDTLVAHIMQPHAPATGCSTTREATHSTRRCQPVFAPAASLASLVAAEAIPAKARMCTLLRSDTHSM
jgi:hypothetical protein